MAEHPPAAPTTPEHPDPAKNEAEKRRIETEIERLKSTPVPPEPEKAKAREAELARFEKLRADLDSTPDPAAPHTPGVRRPAGGEHAGDHHGETKKPERGWGAGKKRFMKVVRAITFFFFSIFSSVQIGAQNLGMNPDVDQVTGEASSGGGGKKAKKDDHGHGGHH